MSKNMESKRANHINIKDHFLRMKIKDGEIEFGYIETQKKDADIFTKALPISRLLKSIVNIY